jgi:cytochrome c oxidase subunit 2
MKRIVMIAMLILGLAAPYGFAQMGGGMMGGGMMGRGGYGYGYPQRFASNGEQIFFTGTSWRGGIIPFEGGPMWLRMHGGGCVSCHGSTGQGGAPVMMGTAIPPDIRYKSLTSGEHHHGEGEEGEEHEKYTDDLIKRAVTRGIDPEGKPLDWTMPRYYMNDVDFYDLLEFLKTLK